MSASFGFNVVVVSPSADEVAGVWSLPSELDGVEEPAALAGGDVAEVTTFEDCREVANSAPPTISASTTTAAMTTIAMVRPDPRGGAAAPGAGPGVGVGVDGVGGVGDDVPV